MARRRAGGGTLSHSVRQGHTEVRLHTHERAHAHAHDTDIPRAHGRAARAQAAAFLPGEGGDSRVERQLEPSGPFPPRPEQGLRNRRRLRWAPAARC